MTPLSEMIFGSGGIALSVIGMLLLLGQIYLAINVFSHKRSIESAGGKLTITYEPQVTLTVVLPENN